MAIHQYKREELRKILRKNGYYVVKQKGNGSHEVWKKHGVIKPFMFPLSMSAPLVRREIREHNLVIE